MASPITWRNVSGPDFTGAAAILGRSQDNFENMFSGFQNVMDTARNTQIANQENQVRLNTEQFEQMLRDRYKTPEELQAAREAGEIQGLRDQLGPLNTERTNAAAVDNLVTGMQQRATQQYNYDQQQRTQKLQPVMDTYLQRMNSIDSSGGIANINRSYDEILDEIEADESLDAKAKNDLTKQIFDFRNSREADYRTDTSYLQQQEDRRKRLAKEEALEEADYLARNTIQQFHEQLTAYSQAEADILGDYGLQSGDLENPEITSQIPTDALEEINQRISALGEVPTERAALTALRRELSQNRNLTNQDIMTQLGWAEDINFDVGELTKTEQRDLAAEEARIDSKHSQHKNAYKQWAMSDESPAAAANRVLAATRDNWIGTWDDELIHEKAMEFMTEGVKLEGAENRVKLPPEAVEYLLNRPDLGKFWSGKDPNAAMKALLADDYWADELERYNTAEREKRELRGNYTSNARKRVIAGQTAEAVSALNAARRATQQAAEQDTGGTAEEEVETSPQQSTSTQTSSGGIGSTPLSTLFNAPDNMFEIKGVDRSEVKESLFPGFDVPQTKSDISADLTKKLDDVLKKAKSTSTPKEERDRLYHALSMMLPTDMLKEGSKYLSKDSNFSKRELSNRGEVGIRGLMRRLNEDIAKSKEGQPKLL